MINKEQAYNKVEEFTEQPEAWMSFVRPENLEKILWEHLGDFYEKSVGSTRRLQGYYPSDIRKYIHLSNKFN